MGQIKYVCVSGFFGSGSSAVVDLLKEFKGYYECSAEIRVIKDPYGIVQLENSLVNQWELINSTAAITDFLQLCKICARKRGGPFSRAGLGYSESITPKFYQYAEEYVGELSDYTYDGEYYYHKFKKPYYRYVTDRILFGIEYYSKRKIRTTSRNSSKCYYAHPSQERFNRATQAFFSKIFANKFEEGFSTIILDQAISPNNTSVVHRYLEDAKMIIVDRDPRDMFIDDYLYAAYYEKDFFSSEAGKKYALRQRALRESLPKNDDDILVIKFESLINDYENTVQSIIAFLSLESTTHVLKGKYLIPDKSRKNIGIWRNYPECKDAIQSIENELPDYCDS